MVDLVELDSLEITVIVDNELDPISPCPNETVQQIGSLRDIGINGVQVHDDRGGAKRELRMDSICCSAHGLSLMITGVKGEERHTILFDAGPEEHVWERNAKRLKANIGDIELLHLSHWHRDHSGGLPMALRMINAARGDAKSSAVDVDLHPARPDFRGFMAMEPISLEADPTFDEISAAGGKVQKNDQTHAVAGNMFMISGEIPRVTSYEVGLRRGLRFDASKGKWESDEMMRDERLVMCKLEGKGIVMFTGCSHAGVVNAARHAVELGKGTPLYSVMGGFHLADAEPDMIKQTVQDLKALNPTTLLAGHCTGWRAKFELQQEMPGRLVPSFVGSKFVL